MFEINRRKESVLDCPNRYLVTRKDFNPYPDPYPYPCPYPNPNPIPMSIPFSVRTHDPVLPDRDVPIRSDHFLYSVPSRLVPSQILIQSQRQLLRLRIPCVTQCSQARVQLFLESDPMKTQCRTRRAPMFLPKGLPYGPEGAGRCDLPGVVLPKYEVMWRKIDGDMMMEEEGKEMQGRKLDHRRGRGRSTLFFLRFSD